MYRRALVSGFLYKQEAVLSDVSAQFFQQKKCFQTQEQLDNDSNNQYFRRYAAATVATLAAFGTAGVALYRSKLHAASSLENDQKQPEDTAREWPVYTRDQVAEHATRETRIWTIYKDSVYDVTDFVHEHPGGDKILLAAGASLEPWWDLYAVHKGSKEVGQALERLKIGVIPESEVEEIDVQDPYGNDPHRHPELIVLSKTPFNAEMPHRKITDDFVTPIEYFYVRNHLPVPEVEIDDYRLTVECPDRKKSIDLSYVELKKQFQPVTVSAAIQCTGNRRDGINRVKKTKGLEWKLGAISNAEWTGVRLTDVMAKMGITEDNYGDLRHVIFEGMDQDPTGSVYGASIPIHKVMAKDKDVILAYEMNGQPLPRDHGFPLRVVAPGIVGARSVKWLQRIRLSRVESDSHWQQKDYKLFSPSTDWDTVDFSKSPAIQEANVQSAICLPLEGDTVPKGAKTITVKGYAWSGGGRGIVRVDVTSDGGRAWHNASLEQHPDQDLDHMWAWTLWSAEVPIPPGGKSVELICKATDISGNAQPDSPDGIWNLRGCLNNSWHRVNVKLA